MYTATAIVYPSTLATSVTLPMEILQAASQMASVEHRGHRQVRFTLAGPNRRLMRLDSGIALKPDMSYAQLPPSDLLLLPAIWRNPLPTVRAAASWLHRLPALAGAGTRICSVGTGSYLLAEAGLLDGRAATTHWHYFEQFQRRYPQVELKTRHLITQSDNIYCAGSVNSIADLMVHIVQEWFGGRIARAVENQFSPEIRQTFRAAAYHSEPDSAHHDETVLRAQQYLQDNLARPLPMPRLAARLGLTARSLHRRFVQATGVSPQNYLQSLRMATAKDLLRHTNLTVGEIAWRIGLQDTSYFSQLFRRHCGVSPLRYRAAVRGKLFDPAGDEPALRNRPGYG